MLSDRHHQRGVTLVELMIASVIALIALSALLAVYSATARHGSELLQQAHLHQQLHGLLHLVSRDLRRAGYWHFNPSLRSPTTNPFHSAANRLRIAEYPSELSDSCILFSYDLDQDGLVGVGTCARQTCDNQTDSDNVEQFGFRFRGTQVQSRYGGAEFACDNGYWQTVNDPAVEINRLHFTEHAHCLNLLNTEQPCTPDSPGLIQRTIAVELSGQLRNRPDTRTQMTHWVRVRNHQLREGQAW